MQFYKVLTFEFLSKVGPTT